ncbi:uncharacterized protein RB166_021236 [Leptodactylus fuscus]|uniref:uncharacterized protein LOC142187365 n=1 Tax=Leptodactylus fuscus TaxID=238119 RepID=UPI003F4E5034
MDSHRQRYPVTYVKEEPSFSGGRQDQEVTQQYQPSHVKDDPVPQNRRTPARSNIYPKKDLAEERSPPYRRKKPVPCGNRNLKPKAQDGAPTREKDGLISHDPTHASIYVIKDLTQQCSSPGTKETPVPCGGEKPHHHPSTQVKEDTSLSDPNPPGTQTMASDHISVQHSCSECQKCFVSMEELVSHQGIHLVEKLFQNGNRVFTTTFMSIPQEAPVKLKLLRCSKCDRTFSTKSSLVVHMKTHWPKQYEIFRCEKCGKYLFSRSQLDRHLRGHF